MIFFRFLWNKAPDAADWCRINATDYKFTRNSFTAITGVWLNENDAIMFRIKFGINHETKIKSIDN